MTVKQPTVESQRHGSPDWYKRLFAWMMARGQAAYEEALSDRKQALEADLHGIAFIPTSPLFGFGIEPELT